MEKEDTYIGQSIGSFRLIKKLGKGSFGSVYLAQHIYLNRSMVAIKILDPKYLDTDKEKEAFLNEARFLDLLKHHHILPIIDVGLQEDMLFMITEYAPNGSLQDRMLSQRPALLPMRETMLILSQIEQALQFAHRHNVVHRDLKPANILFSDKGDALLADFGVAIQLKMDTENVDVRGTPLYMAPEQFNGKGSVKTDQYALACIAYELFTGRPPIIGSKYLNLTGWAHKVLTEEVPPMIQFNPDITDAVDLAIRKALAKDRNMRHTNVAVFMSSMLSQTPLLDVAELPTMIVDEEESAKLLAVTAGIKTLEEWLAEAEGHRKNSRWEEADQAYESAIQLGYKEATVFYAKGYALYQLKKHKEALDAYEEAIELGYSDAMIYYYKGYVLSLLGNFEDALVAYEQAIQIDPNRAMFQNSKGNALRDLMHYAEAKSAYDEAIRLSPNTPIFYLNKGEVLLAIRELDEALDAYTQAIRVASNNVTSAKAHLGKANTLLRLRRSKEAVEAYDKAMELDPKIASASLYLAKGDAFWRFGQNEEALKAYEKGLELDPDLEILQQKRSAMLDILKKVRRA